MSNIVKNDILTTNLSVPHHYFDGPTFDDTLIF